MIHLKMLAHDYPFDTVQMPLNCFDATYRSFEQQVLPELQRQGIAALGMRASGATASRSNMASSGRKKRFVMQ